VVDPRSESRNSAPAALRSDGPRLYGSAMDLSPLSILRLAQQGAPTLRDIAGEIGCSHQAVHLFEIGRASLSPEKLRAYARAVHAKPSDVRRRFLLASLAFHLGKVRDLKRQVRASGGAVGQGRSTARAG